jgi:arylsulfatase A-like enzyme
VPAVRPNILFITSDQHRGDCYGFEGRRVRTPHLDALAAQGTRFSACITPNVVCQPARASILTGLLPRTHGVHDNGIDLDPGLGEAGFAGRLARAGYETGFIGKAHFATYHTHEPTGTPESIKSAADYGPDWNGPYMGFRHVELMLIGHNYWLPYPPPVGKHYERWYYADGRGEEKNRLYAQHLPPPVRAAQTHHSGLPVQWHNSTWTADRAIEYLRTRDRTRPFCLWTSFPDPHHPFDAPAPWSRLHDPEDVDLPPHRARDLDRRPWWHRAALEGTPKTRTPEMRRVREEYSRIPPQDDGQLRELIANYYGMIALIDHGVGRICAALAQEGLADSTLVVFSSDHGDWLGDHGLVLKGPMPYEGLLRVGLIVRGPGVPAGKAVAEPVSTLDLAATFADYAGIDGSWARHSRSLRPLIEGDARRDFALSEWHLLPARTGVELQLRTVRTRRAKLTMDLLSGAGELYDLVDDPHELENRFGAGGALEAELHDMAMSRPPDERPPQVQVGAA